MQNNTSFFSIPSLLYVQTHSLLHISILASQLSTSFPPPQFVVGLKRKRKLEIRQLTPLENRNLPLRFEPAALE